MQFFHYALLFFAFSLVSRLSDLIAQRASKRQVAISS